MKILLVLALIAIQLPAGGAAPVYLCLGHDGSVCFDEGPEACQNCAEPAAEAPADHHACCHHHGDSKPFDECDHSELSMVGNDCGCSHVPISGSRVPVVNSNRVRAEVQQFQVYVPTWIDHQLNRLPLEAASIRTGNVRTFAGLPRLCGNLRLRC